MSKQGLAWCCPCRRQVSSKTGGSSATAGPSSTRSASGWILIFTSPSGAPSCLHRHVLCDMVFATSAEGPPREGHRHRRWPSATFDMPWSFPFLSRNLFVQQATPMVNLTIGLIGGLLLVSSLYANSLCGMLRVTFRVARAVSYLRNAGVVLYVTFIAVGVYMRTPF